MEYVHGGNLHRYTTAKRLLPVAGRDRDRVQVLRRAGLRLSRRRGAPGHQAGEHPGRRGHRREGRGLRRRVHSAGSRPPSSMRVGSPSYIAPEQIRDEPLTHQSDMFSLGRGAVRAALSGARPFRGANTMETLDQVLRLTSRSRLRSCARSCRPQLDPMVLRMLQKYPADRYARLGRAGAGPGAGRPPQRVRPGHHATARSSRPCAARALLSRSSATRRCGS